MPFIETEFSFLGFEPEYLYSLVYTNVLNHILCEIQIKGFHKDYARETCQPSYQLDLVKF